MLVLTYIIVMEVWGLALSTYRLYCNEAHISHFIIALAHTRPATNCFSSLTVSKDMAQSEKSVFAQPGASQYQ
jgi:hypothetical protein